MTNRNDPYVLDEQVGFLLRLASQRHMALFMERTGGTLTPTQFSTLYRLREASDAVSQNALGRLVGMDAATTKGVVARLLSRDLIRVEKDGEDRRRYTLFITDIGRQLLDTVLPVMHDISEATLEPLTPLERGQLVLLLKRLV